MRKTFKSSVFLACLALACGCTEPERPWRLDATGDISEGEDVTYVIEGRAYWAKAIRNTSGLELILKGTPFTEVHAVTGDVTVTPVPGGMTVHGAIPVNQDAGTARRQGPACASSDGRIALEFTQATGILRFIADCPGAVTAVISCASDRGVAGDLSMPERKSTERELVLKLVPEGVQDAVLLARGYDEGLTVTLLDGDGNTLTSHSTGPVSVIPAGITDIGTLGTTMPDPAEPAEPDEPETPDNPDNPGTPEIPDEPDTPDEPDMPDTPDGPEPGDSGDDDPDAPPTDMPQEPEDPGIPDYPQYPDDSDGPDIPDEPDPGQDGDGEEEEPAYIFEENPGLSITGIPAKVMYGNKVTCKAVLDGRTLPSRVESGDSKVKTDGNSFTIHGNGPHGLRIVAEADRYTTYWKGFSVTVYDRADIQMMIVSKGGGDNTYGNSRVVLRCSSLQPVRMTFGIKATAKPLIGSAKSTWLFEKKEIVLKPGEDTVLADYQELSSWVKKHLASALSLDIILSCDDEYTDIVFNADNIRQNLDNSGKYVEVRLNNKKLW